MTQVDDGYAEDGFELRATYQGEPYPYFGSWPTEGVAYTGSVPEGTALFHPAEGGITTLTMTGGGTFDLLSIDLAALRPNNDPGGTVSFTGVKADNSTVTQDVVMSAAPGWETFSFGSTFSGLTSVHWAQLAPFHQFDNITLATGSVVPAPGAAMLVLIGLGMISRLKRHLV